MRARRYLKTRFRAIPDRVGEGEHWLGGPIQHRGADCPNCKIPLVLHWDLNAQDSRFPKKRFGSLDRIPLYYCWTCVADLAYRVDTSNRVRVLSKRAKQFSTNCQYEPYPESFERRPLTLDPTLPDQVRQVYTKWVKSDDPYVRKLGKRETKVLADYFGHPFIGNLSVFHHQFGGMPSTWWGDEAILCPNRECHPSAIDRLRGRQARPMSFLAGIVNDPHNGLPLVERVEEVRPDWWNFYVSVEFQICGNCFTIHARNRCD